MNATRPRPPSLPTPGGRLPSLCGADVELGNFIAEAPAGEADTCEEAACAILREVPGFPRRPGLRLAAGQRGAAFDPRDRGRRYLTNGGCVYIDLDHVELAQPETRSAWDHVAAWHAMLRIARRALHAANAKRTPARRISALACVSDGLGNSWGSHLSLLVRRSTFDNIVRRKPLHALYLASYQISSIVFTGQGKVGGENGAGPARYQLSQRADFFEELIGLQTTSRRPLVNTRDEALAGDGLARLHVIFFDSVLCHTAALLRVGVLQLIVAMIEAGEVDPLLIVDDLLAALRSWSRDPSLETEVRLVSGRRLNAVQHQLEFLERARRFAGRGGFDGVVPRAREILSLWEDTLAKLQALDLDALRRRLDWALKLSILERAQAQLPGLAWDSPEIKCLDLQYSSLDGSEGLYWACERAGLVDRRVSEAQIQRLTSEPPEDTRAWTRGMLLARATPDEVEDVDWDRIRFRVRGRSGGLRFLTLRLPNPLGFHRRAMEPLFRRTRGVAELLNALARDGVRASERTASAGGALLH